MAEVHEDDCTVLALTDLYHRLLDRGEAEVEALLKASLKWPEDRQAVKDNILQGCGRPGGKTVGSGVAAAVRLPIWF